MEGFDPSTDYARDLLALSSFTEFSLLSFAAKIDVDRRRYQLLISRNQQAENDAKRLMVMGREANDLESVYSSIELAVREDMETFSEKINEDLTELDSEFEKHMNQKLMVQRNLENEITELRLSMTDAMDANDSEDRRVFISTRCELHLKYTNAVYDATQRALASMAALDNIFDELHIQRQYEQQKFEAVQNVAERSLAADFGSLMSAQKSRRNLGASLINEYERDLKGLENIFAEKRHQQSEFLKDRLARRKLHRARELELYSGLSPEEVQRIVNEEYSEDLKRGEKEIAEEIIEEQYKEQSAVENVLASELSEKALLEKLILGTVLTSGSSAVTVKAEIMFGDQFDLKVNRQKDTARKEVERDVRHWREEYDAGCRRLEEDLLSAKAKEKSLLRNQLEARRKRREAELRMAGLSKSEAELAAADELRVEEETAFENFDMNAKMEQEALLKRIKLEGNSAENEQRTSRIAMLLECEGSIEDQEALKADFIRGKLASVDKMKESLLKSLKLEGADDAKRLELAHLAALKALSDAFEDKRRSSRKTMEQKLAHLRSQRRAELLASGTTESEADAKVRAECKAFEEADIEALDAEESLAKRNMEDKFKYLLSDIQSQSESCAEIFSVGEEVHLERRIVAMKTALESEREQVISAFKGQGKSQVDAESNAQLLFEQKIADSSTKLQAETALAALKLRGILMDDFESKALAIRAEHEKKIVGLASAQLRMKDEAAKSMRSKLEDREKRRIKNLISLGMRPEEAAEIAGAEVGDIDSLVEEFTSKLSDKHADEFDAKADAFAR